MWELTGIMPKKNVEVMSLLFEGVKFVEIENEMVEVYQYIKDPEFEPIKEKWKQKIYYKAHSKKLRNKQLDCVTELIGMIEFHYKRSHLTIEDVIKLTDCEIWKDDVLLDILNYKKDYEAYDYLFKWLTQPSIFIELKENYKQLQIIKEEYKVRKNNLPRIIGRTESQITYGEYARETVLDNYFLSFDYHFSSLETAVNYLDNMLNQRLAVFWINLLNK